MVLAVFLVSAIIYMVASCVESRQVAKKRLVDKEADRFIRNFIRGK